MDAMVRLRNLDELPGAWRSLRQAARFAQVLTGAVVLVNVALLLLTDRSHADLRWLETLNYVAVVMAFGALTGGFWAERRRQSREDETLG